MNRSARRTAGYRGPSPIDTLYPCTHCGTARLVYPLSDFVGFNRRHPLPGLDQVLDSLVRVYGPDERASMCPGCFCVTTELTGAHTD